VNFCWEIFGTPDTGGKVHREYIESNLIFFPPFYVSVRRAGIVSSHHEKDNGQPEEHFMDKNVSLRPKFWPIKLFFLKKCAWYNFLAPSQIILPLMKSA